MSGGTSCLRRPRPSGARMADEATGSPAESANPALKPCLTPMLVFLGTVPVPLCLLPPPPRVPQLHARSRKIQKLSCWRELSTWYFSWSGGCQKMDPFLAVSGAGVRAAGCGDKARGEGAGRLQWRTSSSDGSGGGGSWVQGSAVCSVFRFWGGRRGKEKRRKKKKSPHEKAQTQTSSPVWEFSKVPRFPRGTQR